MKFLAIFKDSFREAVDSKVLYVMVGLAFVVIVLVGSVSYQPLSAEEAIPGLVRNITEEFENPFVPPPSDRYTFRRGTVSDVRQIGEASQPYLGQYRFQLQCVLLPNRFEKGEVTPAARLADVTEYLREKLQQEDLEVEGLHATAAEPVNTYRFDVRVAGKRGRTWRHDVWLFFGAWKIPTPVTLGVVVHLIENTIFGGIGAWVALIVSVVITSFFIPNMLQKGTIDLLLAKPIGRGTLLIYKYVGGLTFMLLLSTVAFGGAWLVVGLRSGIWSTGLLGCIPALTFFFAILYSVSTLTAVLTRSAIISILAAVLVWFLFAAIGVFYAATEMNRKTNARANELPPEFAAKRIEFPEWLNQTAKVLHAITPRTADLDYLIRQSLAKDLLSEADIRRAHIDKLPDFSWVECFGVSSVFIVIVLGLACWRFSARDY